MQNERPDKGSIQFVFRAFPFFNGFCLICLCKVVMCSSCSFVDLCTQDWLPRVYSHDQARPAQRASMSSSICRTSLAQHSPEKLQNSARASLQRMCRWQRDNARRVAESQHVDEQLSLFSLRRNCNLLAIRNARDNHALQLVLCAYSPRAPDDKLHHKQLVSRERFAFTWNLNE